MYEPVRELTLDKHEDTRGSFMRIFDSTWGGVCDIKQVSLSSNPKALTLRGLHGMRLSADEYKLVSCIEGQVMDVVVDIRPNSELYLKPQYFLMESNSPSSLVIPPGHLHGFLTLKDNSSILYAMTSKFYSQLEIGVRWDDPLLKIQWPEVPKVISERDRNFPFLSKAPQL
jgi:dTDP-4-dehydrorhamnose 3,5-epimerase